MRKRRAIFLFFFSLFFVQVSISQGDEPKNVILVIGDGMGPQIVGLAIYYNLFMNGPEKPLNLEKLMATGNTGYCLTYQFGTVVTDSASAATALASGVKTRDAIVGKDHEGRNMKTLTDVALQGKKSVGIISDTRMTHATPAAFYAQVIHRDMENEIAAQLVERGDIQVAFSGGAQHFIPEGSRVEEHPDLKGILKEAGWGISKRKDKRNLIEEAKRKGYKFVSTDEQLKSLDAQTTDKVFGLFSASGFPSAIDRQPHLLTGVPTLNRLTEKALEILSRNSQGFFLMVEGGQVDWVAHDNDVASVLHEMKELDQTLGAILKFAEAHPDTLVIVTADHDTGGLAIAYSNYQPPASVALSTGENWKTKYNFGEKDIFEKMAKQKKSFQKMVIDSKGNPAALKKEVENNSAFALTQEEAERVLSRDPQSGYPKTKADREIHVYGQDKPMALMGRLFGREMNTAWAVGTHTHTPVMVMGIGPGAERFRGLLDNVQIPRIIAQGWGATLPAPK
jgi:alkaline phosphatase